MLVEFMLVLLLISQLAPQQQYVPDIQHAVSVHVAKNQISGSRDLQLLHKVHQHHQIGHVDLAIGGGGRGQVALIGHRGTGAVGIHLSPVRQAVTSVSGFEGSVPYCVSSSSERPSRPVTSALKQLEIKGFPLNITFPNEFEINSNDIIILKIDTLDSEYYKAALKSKQEITNKFIIVIRNTDALLVTTLLKQGFFDIFVFPYEVLKFTSFLSEIISNKVYITEANRIGTFGMNRQGIKSILGESEKLMRAVDLATKVSEKSNSNVLILGETGTGKGLFARAIHNNGPEINFHL